ncbi:MAG: DUF3048 domain-containing protein [Lachnospiraceae bacterium]|nr:DUF3048 domain-containing protein [Lachnospiraceae bacterium]
MKKKAIAALIAAVSLSLAACALPWASSETSTEEPTETSVSLDFSYTNGTSQTVVPDPIVDDSNSAAEHNKNMQAEYDLYDPAPGTGYVRSDLTNDWIPADAGSTRPIAVMIPNNLVSLPHYTLSQAGVLYECNVEYEITRLMAIYDNWTGLERIGNIRSARDYFVYWGMEWDPLFIHIGNIWYADAVLSEDQVNNINGAVYDKYFYRVTNERRDYDQTAYINGYNIKNAASALKYSLEHTSLYQPGHFSFASKGNPTTLTDVKGYKSATYVSLAEAYPIDQPYFTYNEEDGLYYRYEYGSPHMDGQNNTQLSFSNIIIQNTYREYRPDGAYLIYRCHDTTKDGWFITHGSAVHVNWKKVGEFGVTKYYDDNGDEIILNQGKTMICIVQDGDGVIIQ